MICVKCFHRKTTVNNSRPHKTTPSIWRRRQCLRCGHVFTTVETPELTNIASVNGEPLSTARLTVELAHYLSHRGHEAADDASWLAITIVHTIWNNQNTALTGGELSAIIHPILDRFDPAAGLRYGMEHGLITSTSQAQPRRGRPRLKPRP